MTPRTRLSRFFSLSFRRPFSIWKASPRLSKPHPGWTWLRSSVEDHKYHPIICRATNSVRAASLSEDRAIRGIVWPGRLFERGFWDCGEVTSWRMLDERDSPSEASVDDGMWEMWAWMKIARVIPGFRWDGNCTWWTED